MKTPPGFPTRHPSAMDVNSPPAYETRPSSPQSNQLNGAIEMLSVPAANTPAGSLQDKFPVLSSLVDGTKPSTASEVVDIELQRPTLLAKRETVKKVKTERRKAQERRFKEVATPIIFVGWLVLWITLVTWGAPKDGGWGEKGKPIKVWAVLAGSLIGAVPVLFSILMCLGKYIRHGGSAVEELE